MLDVALDYHRRGWSVILAHGLIGGKLSCGKSACKSPGKHPRVSWKKYTETQADEAEIRKWWKDWPDASVGIITGRISGITVVDIDGDEGKQALKAAGIVAPTTVTVLPGGGGWHYYYRYPESGLSNATKARILEGVDIRADGGFVIAPPSTHESGNSYQWAQNLGPDDLKMADLPPEILELLTPSVKKANNPQMRSALQGVSERQRDETLYRYACGLRGKGISREEVLAPG